MLEKPHKMIRKVLSKNAKKARRTGILIEPMVYLKPN